MHLKDRRVGADQSAKAEVPVGSHIKTSMAMLTLLVELFYKLRDLLLFTYSWEGFKGVLQFFGVTDWLPWYSCITPWRRGYGFGLVNTSLG